MRKSTRIVEGERKRAFFPKIFPSRFYIFDKRKKSLNFSFTNEIQSDKKIEFLQLEMKTLIN